jgi:hypothetical protein
MHAEVGQARQAIEASSGDLANQIIRAVLPLAAGGTR